jgi:hypothetical protein
MPFSFVIPAKEGVAEPEKTANTVMPAKAGIQSKIT